MENFPEKKLMKMLTLMGDLCAVIHRENTLMKDQRQNECVALLEQKTKLSAAYGEAFAYFSERGEILKALPEKQKNVFRKAARTLNALTQENAMLLKVNMDAAKRLINAIITDVEEQKHAGSALYTRKGRMDSEKGNPAALSFNEVL